MADSRVGIQIVAENRATPAIQQVQRSMRGLDDAADMVSKGIAGFAGSMGVGAIIGLAQQVGGAAVRMAELAQQSHMVRTSMQGLAASFGQNADDMIGAMQRASGGTISEYNLMLAANKAMMLGVASNATELEGILRVAMTRGSAMGLSTTQAFDDLVTGLGRGSALILDNLGITMASLRQAEEAYAAAIGKTTDELSDQERKQAMVNAVLKEAAGIDPKGVDQMAGGFARLRAEIADLAAVIGEQLRPALDAAAGAAADVIDAVVEGVPTLPLNDQLVAAQRNVDQLSAAWAAVESSLPRDQVRAVIGMQEDLANNIVNNDLAQAAQLGSSTGYLLEYVKLLQTLVDAEEELGRVRRQVYAEDMSAGESVRIESQLASLDAYKSKLQEIITLESAAQQAYRSSQDAIRQMADSMASGLLPDLGPQVFGMVEGWASQYQKQFDALTANGYTAAQALEIIAVAADRDADALRNAAAGADEASKGIGSLAGNAAAAGANLDTLSGKANNAATAFGNMATQARDALFAAAGSNIKSAALSAAGTLGAAQAQEMYNVALADVEGLRADLLASGRSMVDIEFELAAATQRNTDAIQAAALEQDRLNRATENGTTAASAYAASVGDVNSALASRVNSAVQDAFSLDVGVKSSNFLPRQDAPNENARRLAALARDGLQGQDWLGEFSQEVPDIYGAIVGSQDPAMAAAQFLQQFEQGFLPQLIDKEALKAQIKEQLAGDANMASYAQEIMQELIAEGAGDPAAVQKAVNQTMGTSMGKTTGPTDVTSGVVSQLKAETFLKQVNGAGGDAAAQWGSAFLASVGENVPMALIMILATLVAPILAQGQADAAGQTGAQ